MKTKLSSQENAVFLLPGMTAGTKTETVKEKDSLYQYLLCVLVRYTVICNTRSSLTLTPSSQDLMLIGRTIQNFTTQPATSEAFPTLLLSFSVVGIRPTTIEQPAENRFQR